MHPRTAAAHFARVVLLALAIDAAVVGAIGAIGWIAGWRAASQFASAIGWAALGALAVGASAVMGAWMSRDEMAGYAATTSPSSSHDRVRRMMRDVSTGYARLILFLLVAAGLFGVAFWLDSLP